MRAKVAKRLRRLVTELYGTYPGNKFLVVKGTITPYSAIYSLNKSVQAINQKYCGRAIYQKLKKTYKSGVKF